MSIKKIMLLLVVTGLVLTSCSSKPPVKEENWISLFNGENLDGWTPKFSGHELGVNYNNTVRVEDGILKICYDEWDEFKGEFGHIFYKDKFSHYKIRAVYRFVGEQVKGGAGWAIRNNGLMLHCQDPKTMEIDQDFPVCIEVQLLGGNGSDERPTANLCTPSTHVHMGDSLHTAHCTNSISPTFHGDQWVTCEVEVKGGETIRHFVNGEEVMAYNNPVYDDSDKYGKKFTDAGITAVTEGWISIQAETGPTEFRKIELLVLED